MKKFVLIFLFLFVLTSPIISQERENKSEAKSTQRSKVLEQKAKLDETIDEANKTVESRETAEKISVMHAALLVNLATLRKERLALLKKQNTTSGFDTQELVEFSEIIKNDTRRIEALMREAIDTYAKLPIGETLALASLKLDLVQFLIHHSPTLIDTTEKGRRKFWDEVETLYLQALATQEKLSGADSDLTLKTVETLADFYETRVEFESALQFYERYLETTERRYDSVHRNLVPGLRGVGRILAVTDRQTEADALAKRTSLITGKMEKILAPNRDLIDRVIKIRTISSVPLTAFSPNQPGINILSFKRIVVNILVDEQGNVTEAKVIGETKKAKEVEKATLKATFRPFVYKGEARKMRGHISYFFTE